MSSKDLETALEEAVSGTKPESTTGKEAEPKPGETPKADAPDGDKGEGEKSKAVPYDRFKEVNEERKSLTEQLEGVQGKLNSRDQEVSKLVDLAEAREFDSKVVAKINELHGDPRYADIIERLDKAVQGIDEEVEAGEVKPEAAMEKATKLLQDTKSELQEEMASQRDDLILDRADRLVEKYFDELPDDYNDDDKARLGKDIIEHIDYGAIEENADVLPDVIHKAVQNTVNAYGEPRGALIAKAAEVQDKTPNETPESKSPSIEDLTGREWGKLKTVTTPKGDELRPEVSEGEFTEALGEAIRLDRKT